jgi:hypothetical protein
LENNINIQMMKDNVTVVITSSNRPELLFRTLYSFLNFNTYGISKIIIIDDSENTQFHETIKKIFGTFCEIICNPKRIGQIKSIDEAYSIVKTPWIFHCEDDWEFYRGGFIEDSLSLMKADPKILQVWLRELGDTNGHPVLPEQYTHNDVSYYNLSFNYLGYNGFSFNPGLKRLSDYELIKPYSEVPFDPRTHPTKTARFYCPEMEIGEFYFNLGFRAVILTRGSVKHIGGNARVGWN